MSENVLMQQKRGPKSTLPTSAPAGQLLVTTDTNELFVGTGTGVVQLGAYTYTFNQVSSASVWTINHNLGKFPSVTLVDLNGEVVEGSVTYTNANQIICAFNPAFAGRAYLN